MRFKFLNLGQRSKIFVDNVLATINTYYDKEKSIRIEKTDPDLLGEPFDEIQYQAFHDTPKGELKSNIAKIIVNFPPDKSLFPGSTDNQIVMENNQEISIFDHISYNEAVDRVKILSFEAIGDITFYSNYIFENKEIMQYDFSHLRFKSRASGTGYPYQEIRYQVGNVNSYNDTVYSLKINIEGEASLLEVEEPDVQETENSKSIIYSLKVQNGVVMKTAKIEYEVSLPAEVFENSDNEVQISYRGNTIGITENGTFNFVTELDQNGEDEILLQIDLFLENNNIEGFIKFTLLEVDENPLLVSSTNEQTLTLTAL